MMKARQTGRQSAMSWAWFVGLGGWTVAGLTWAGPATAGLTLTIGDQRYAWAEATLGEGPQAQSFHETMNTYDDYDTDHVSALPTFEGAYEQTLTGADGSYVGAGFKHRTSSARQSDGTWRIEAEWSVWADASPGAAGEAFAISNWEWWYPSFSEPVMLQGWATGGGQGENVTVYSTSSYPMGGGGPKGGYIPLPPPAGGGIAWKTAWPTTNPLGGLKNRFIVTASGEQPGYSSAWTRWSMTAWAIPTPTALGGLLPMLWLAARRYGRERVC